MKTAQEWIHKYAQEFNGGSCSDALEKWIGDIRAESCQPLLFALQQERERYAWIRGELDKTRSALDRISARLEIESVTSAECHKTRQIAVDEIPHTSQVQRACDDAIANITDLLNSDQAMKEP